MNEKTVDVLIIGAGASGAAMSWSLACLLYTSDAADE